MPARLTAAPSPSPEEAAAIVAAIERFARATAPPSARPAPAGLDGWHEAALLEGAARDPWAAERHPWINT